MRPPVRRGVHSLLLLLLIHPLAAQGQPADPLPLRGSVLRDGVPLAGASVVLHRVSASNSGELDSIRTGTEGTFTFPLPGDGSWREGAEVYFASVRHQGVLYFGSAVSERAQLDSIHQILVFDTAMAPPEGIDVPVEVRNLVIESDVLGGWRVTDLLQLRNAGSRTWVPREGGFVWRYPLPEGAADLSAGQSDLPEERLAFENGEVRISAPVPPGEKLFILQYTLPGLETVLPLPGSTERIEVLVREPAPPLGVRGLATGEPMELEPGSTYRSFYGEGLSDVDVRFSLSADEPEGFRPEMLVALVSILLGGGGILLYLRSVPHPPGRQTSTGRGGAPSPPDPVAHRAALLARIAKLDEEWEQSPGDDAGRRRWEEERQRLKAELRRSGR